MDFDVKYPEPNKPQSWFYNGDTSNRRMDLAEIGKHWKQEGRGAGVYVNVGKLVKAKKLKRENVKGERGSRYTTI
jgi:hypothetical protein